MKKSIQELADTLQLLEIEKEEEQRIYEETIKNKTLDERKKMGTSWYPLEVKKTGYALGDFPFLIVERTTLRDERHQFQAGSVVNLFSQHPDAEGKERKGVVHYSDRNKMKIILYSSPMPHWVTDGKIGIDLLFDERTFKEMEKALIQVMEAKGNRLAELREILLGHHAPSYRELARPLEIPSLNVSQNEAVNTILAAEDVAIIHGPPGTGKTTTIVQAIKQLAKVENTILVCAPSNAATDLLTERLAEQQLHVVRIGNISRVDEGILEHTLDAQLAAHPESKTIKKVKKQAQEIRRQAGKYRRKFGFQERQQRRELYQEAKELANWAVTLEDRLIDQLLTQANVVTCTLVGANNKYLERSTFRTVVIDEAAQALEPATWIPIAKAGKVLLAGDPLQLPPTVKSIEAQRKGLSKTLIEKCIDRLPRVNLLDTQYRMHEKIMGFSNAQFYQGKLKAHDSVRTTILPLTDGRPDALEFIDTAGCGFQEQQNEKTLSRFNPDEYTLLREHLLKLIEQLPADLELSIGIISPYKEQVLYIQGQMETEDYPDTVSLSINTIDGFQGQERDVIYISLVRSNEKGEIGFLKDHRRMNVAMTRAKKKLVVIGDSATLGNHAFYRSFLEYCERQEAYGSAWEWMV